MYNLYIGIDDTDSQKGMCTTYITSVIIDKLKSCGYNIEGYPKLIRLNPFAKYKTRGNGAVSFKISSKSENDVETIKKLVLSYIEDLSELEDERTNPGVVFYQGPITEELERYALKTIRDIVSITETEKLADKIGADVYKFKNGRGIIGALAAIGCPLPDKTYELLAYRLPENYGKNRMIDYDSVRLMNGKTYPETFDNLDNGYIAIEPHTPCPILYGIRGESPEIVLEAHNLVKTLEKVERYRIYETNQHTDMHLVKIDKIRDVKKYSCYIVQGTVNDAPHTIEGGHVIFSLKDSSGEVECAAYEPTKNFRDTARKLIKGDELIVYGGVGNMGTLNMEKFSIKHLNDLYQEKNPICSCGKRMKSAGKGKGFKCTKCGIKLREGSKIRVEVERDLDKGCYEVPPSARRHLSKPLVRFYR
ncbi:MAG: tRNA(Ile)(2)-agmatinylcytidine synthase [Methanobacteriaceae archaeon]|nr:tRNA(Ile)(2)-agmatinylcytidine synthase [Methanobacteriaceae archaeon]